MTKEEIKEALLSYVSFKRALGDMDKVSKLIEAYFEEEHINEEKWISVEDRLPHHCETVAVISFHMIYIGYYNELINQWIVDGEDDDHVTHWMPLPKAPK